MVIGKPHSLGSRLGLQSRLRFGREREVRSNRKCTRARRSEVIGDTPVPRSPKRKLRDAAMVIGKPHSLGSRLGLRSNRKYTRVEKPEVIGNALPAQKPEAQAEGMRVVACKRPAVRLVGAANVCHQNVDLGLPCPTASNKPHGRTPADRLTTCPLACPSRVADAAWQRRHGRTRANSRPPPAPPR
jgi:hypothetical protein